MSFPVLIYDITNLEMFFFRSNEIKSSFIINNDMLFCIVIAKTNGNRLAYCVIASKFD